ncbi:hypothetical protein ABEV79_15470 [Bacillus licheniformis]|uniref:hypothetical protein n=1 Tax=Bacillus licheniformis TaxID=1402 RepID=UPI002ACA23FA|nr:hypothetical protein [Bacillus licheniformis]MDZ5536392.1 hypothetical protein [Bacillus licheniformis]
MANPINAALNAVEYIRSKYGSTSGSTSVSIKPYTGYVTPITFTTAKRENYVKVKLPGYSTEEEREATKSVISGLMNGGANEFIFAVNDDGGLEVRYKRKETEG